MNIQELIENQQQQQREKINRELALLENAAAMLAKMPEEYAARIIAGCAVVCESVIFYGCDRPMAEAVMRTLNAGRWEKRINSEGNAIHYTACVDGCEVQIYSVPPPPSCHIEIEEVEIPAHKEKRRKLVCN